MSLLCFFGLHDWQTHYALNREAFLAGRVYRQQFSAFPFQYLDFACARCKRPRTPAWKH